MSSPETFDEFYAQTRDQLLLETYALTGDLAASRSAVRDAYAVAWHHWRKVSRQDEREAWVRPLAYGRAQRRHTAKWWHRDKRLDDDARATFQALSTLSSGERRVLVLGTLSGTSVDEMVRTVGRPRAEFERELRRATSTFAKARGVHPDDVPATLEDLAPLLERTRWAEAPHVRRQGAARRRTVAVVGVLLTVSALLVTGTALSRGEGADAVSLRDETVMPPVTLKPVSAETAPPADEKVLLDGTQVARLDRSLAWSDGETATDDSATKLECQPDPLSDLGGAALVRSYAGKGKKSAAARATEVVVTSDDAEQAMTTYGTVRAWFTRCDAPRVQLLTTHTLDTVGDEATLFTLRNWQSGTADLSLAVARSGDLTLATTVRSTAGKVEVDDMASLLSAAVNRACGTAAAGTCAGQPDAKAVPPLPIGDPAGLLSVVDMPPVKNAKGPWTGTNVIKPEGNPAATRCDDTKFTGKSLRNPVSRTFVFLGTPKAREFGLAQVSALTSPGGARAFVDQTRTRIRQCAEDGFGTRVTKLHESDKKSSAITAWVVEVEVSQSRTVPFMMAVMREGNTVSQVGFSPAGDMTMAREDFVAVSRRALERLSDTPGFKG